MNKNNAAAYLPLVQAMAEGKTIQVKLNEKDTWRTCPELMFMEPPECYRIKPEPRVLWAVYDRKSGERIFTSQEEDSPSIRSSLKSNRNDYEVVKMVEEIQS